MANKWIILVLSTILSQIWAECPPQDAILPCRCLTKGSKYQIWCSHSDLPSILTGLNSLSQHFPHPIDELILENNFLPSLKGRTFHPLKVLRLMLRHNGLERASSDFLIGLEPTLMELYIVEPDLRSLPEDSVHRLRQLEAITIRSNALKRHPDFTGLQKLKFLQLDSLSLLELAPSKFSGLETLKTLQVGNGEKLERLEAGFLQDLDNLQVVNISYCGLKWIHPRAITRLASLKELALTGNKISDVGMVGRAVRDLPKLESLHLDYNLIEAITEASFVDLPALKHLHLSNNQIVELQFGAFHRVPSLRTLDLTRNQVRRVHPEAFLHRSDSGLAELLLVENSIRRVSELRSLLDTLPRLAFLDMSRNRLEAVPAGALRGHPTLEHLNLDFNRIEVIEPEAFGAMPALRELRLRNNSLSDDGRRAPLWDLPALKGLDLSGNLFRTVTGALLARLPSLRKLDLSRNRIEAVEPEAFLATPALELCNLSTNRLAALHPGAFRPLLSLYELDVSHNRLTEAVANLPLGLERLRLAGNRIRALPGLDFHLPSLKSLDLARNELARLPAGVFGSLAQLRRLHLAGNGLQRLEERSLAGLARLEVLDLSANRLRQLHPDALRAAVGLRELRLDHNRLEALFPELFAGLARLERLSFSDNRLAEVADGTWAHCDRLEAVDGSFNRLVRLPASLAGMRRLRRLDLSGNRLRDIEPEALRGLAGLEELRLGHNFVAELRGDAFAGLSSLRLLALHGNQIGVVEANAVRGLPQLRALTLAENKLAEIPNFAFSALPALRAVELQGNEIRAIGGSAFDGVGHLLMLNLSGNRLGGMEDAGLQGLRSLEMLDVSRNRIERVQSESLERMEWLVELRMNANRICAVFGSPFDGMPRLRVLDLSGNQMVTLPEQAIGKIRTNLAVIELEGNPLSCSCNLLWFQTWLLEGATIGPHCADGSLLREMRLSRDECPPEEQSAELVAPGCELAPPAHTTAQVSWARLKSNVSGFDAKNGLVPPLPEESDYFYDEYVDYFNETGANLTMAALTTPRSTLPIKSPHYTTGDTPTIYAAPTAKNRTANVPKEVINSPSTSGFTFFGLPLPAINLNKLLGTDGRNSDVKNAKGAKMAERKSAIVNRQPQVHVGTYGLPSAPLVQVSHRLPSAPQGQANYGLPNLPQVQNGGFTPFLPGIETGFTPIVPSLVTEASNYSRIEASSDTDRKKPEFRPTTETPEVSSAPPTRTTSVEPVPVQIRPELETGASFEHFFNETVDVTSTTAKSTTSTQTSTAAVEIITEAAEVKETKGPTALSGLLVPGGQQPEFRRSTITKVQSPHGSALLQGEPERHVEPPQPHNREGKTSKELFSSIEPVTLDPDTSWYFANYNKTNLEPFIGVSETVANSTAASIHVSIVLVLVSSLVCK